MKNKNHFETGQWDKFGRTDYTGFGATGMVIRIVDVGWVRLGMVIPSINSKVSPVKVSPVKVSPGKVSPVKVSPVKVSPVKISPVKVSLGVRSLM